MAQPRRPQMCKQIAPWFEYGAHATRHRDGSEMPDAAISAIVGEQEFSAPECSVCAPSEAIERDTEHRRRIKRKAILGEARSDVGVMMLNFDQRQIVRGGRIAREL